jgi:hypothetical protein
MEREKGLDDKIFDNSYGTYEMSEQINLNLESSLKIDSYESKIDYDVVYDKIYMFFEANEDLEIYLKSKEDLKLTNVELNRIYAKVSAVIPKEFHIEMFTILGELLDTNLPKFYEILSNKFKTELIGSLKGRGFLLKQYTLF